MALLIIQAVAVKVGIMVTETSAKTIEDGVSAIAPIMAVEGGCHDVIINNFKESSGSIHNLHMSGFT